MKPPPRYSCYNFILIKLLISWCFFPWYKVNPSKEIQTKNGHVLETSERVLITTPGPSGRFQKFHEHFAIQPLGSLETPYKTTQFHQSHIVFSRCKPPLSYHDDQPKEMFGEYMLHCLFLPTRNLIAKGA